MNAYTEFTEKLHTLAKLQNQLDALQAQSGALLINNLGPFRKQFAKLNQQITELRGEIENMALANPDWFANKRTIETQFGTVKLKSSTRLVAPNEELSLRLIQKEAELQVSGKEAAFDATALLRTKTELNLEALGELDDATLARFKIKREQNESLTITPIKADLATTPRP